MSRCAHGCKYKCRFELIGRRFGELLVIASAPGHGGRWLCLCDCGKEKEVTSWDLLHRGYRSCGCGRWRKGIAPKTHGRCGSRTHSMSRTPTYLSWAHMKTRVLNPNNDRYHRYGGRGIQICERWFKFENFLADMGERPKGTTLDRISNDGHYEPGNCRWATPKQQQNNTRRCRIVEHQGRRQNATQWAHKIGIAPSTLRTRLERGWSVERAMLEPVVSRGSDIEYQGVRQTVAQWSGQTGIPSGTLRSRLRRGWDLERALTMPIRIFKATKTSKLRESLEGFEIGRIDGGKRQRENAH